MELELKLDPKEFSDNFELAADEFEIAFETAKNMVASMIETETKRRGGKVVTKVGAAKKVKTKNGKLVVRAKGQNHFNAKASGSKRSQKRRSVSLALTTRARRRFLPGMAKAPNKDVTAKAEVK